MIRFEGMVPIFPVADLDVSIDYYTRVLGFRIEFFQKGIIASIARGKCELFLTEGDQGNAPSWAFAGVSSVDKLLAEIEPRGARIRQPPTNYPWGYEVQVEDPDGNVLRFGSEQQKGLPLGPWRDMRGDLWGPPEQGRWPRLTPPRQDVIRRERAKALRELAEIERASPETAQASREHYQQAVDLWRELDDRLALAHTVRHLGDVCFELGDAARALACCEEAVALYRRHGQNEPLHFANAIRSLALVREAGGDRSAALELWREAHDLYVRVNVAAGIGETAARIERLKQ
jgi:predicted enzyme related to lactoylglutathione lyase